MPSEDTLNVATVVSSISLPNVWWTALDIAWGPVRDSVSTLFMYTTLHAKIQNKTQRSNTGDGGTMISSGLFKNCKSWNVS